MQSIQEFIRRISDFIPADRIINDELRRLAFGTDASFYRLIPRLVVKVENEDEVSKLIRTAGELSIPLTFRAAGTSLSGQSITDSVLVLLSHTWNMISINSEGSKITLQAGVTGGYANARLALYNKKLGPDPASINSAKISGIAANNASGMTSGTKYNIYNTLSGMRIIFADGTILDTRDAASRKQFLTTHQNIAGSIKELSDSIKSNAILSRKISEKYRIKNTTGYGLNSLIEFDNIFEIIQHLMIGSEGTIGFISEVTLNTVDNLPFKASALILFKDIKTACQAIPIFQSKPVDAAEIMDRAALRSVENKPGMPEYLSALGENAAALLIETSSSSAEGLQTQMTVIIDSIADLPKEHPVEFTTDPKEYKKLWDVRKGLFPSVCKNRKPGTSVIIEDVNFPTDRLADAAIDLQLMFKKYQYDETIIWGHALSGNLHFVFAPDFSRDSEITRYKNFMDEIAQLVIEKYEGSLKAEHGTGRNMAPFVKYEWGEEAYDVMLRIKKIFDNKNILNPGVLINGDPQVHIKNLKPLPIAHDIVDKCIECGFCEVNCPSKDLTITPRQRIVVWREIQSLRNSRSDDERLNCLIKDYDYFGDQTCAADGLCATSCPVDIDTGKLIKELRAAKTSLTAQSAAQFLADNMWLATSVMKAALNLAHYAHLILGTDLMNRISASLRKISRNKIPRWTQYLPKGADRIFNIENKDHGRKVVYFPSCITRTMGISADYDKDYSITTATLRLLDKAGYTVIYPKNLDNLCCGMAFNSKGYFKAGKKKADELISACKEASENGRYPVLFDMSPCLQRIKEYSTEKNSQLGGMKIFEQVEFIHDHLLDKLRIKKQAKTITIHVTCSSIKMNLNEKFIRIAETCAERVIVPDNVGCCGFAGDRGFTYPELNQSALMNLKPSLPDSCKEGYSNSRTCEIGLSEQGGINYKSIVYLVEDCAEGIVD